MRVAVLGAGRSGLAVAGAVVAQGGQAAVYDAKPANQLREQEAELNALGVGLVAQYTAPFSKDQADILVTSPGVDSRSPILVQTKGNGVEIVSEIEFAYRIAKAPIVAVTGTNGKSTTTVMAWRCLQSVLGENRAVLCGNIFGSGFDEMPLTEAAERSQAEVLVAEISSFQLEWVDRFRPRCAAITNIAEDHQNRYDSFSDYSAVKRRIFARMEGKDCYVHHSDPATNPPVNAPFRDLQTSWDREAIRLPGYDIPIAELPLQQPHNIANAAIAALLAYGFCWAREEPVSAASLNAIHKGLIGFTPLSHRMESVASRNGIELINNSMCTNPAAVIASSSSIAAHQHLLLGGLTKNSDFSPLGRYLAETGHDAYVYGEDGSKLNLQLEGRFPVFRTMAEAFQKAAARAQPGDVIMLAPGCASMDQYRDFRARGEEFEKLAKEWLENDKVPTR